MNAERFLRAALVALDEIGDPTGSRGVIEAALTTAAPRRALPAPQTTVKRVAWHAAKLAMYAAEPARAYAQLHELCTTLFDPIAGARRPAAPAPEVAIAMSPPQLVDALSPTPRVMARELAIAAKLDSAFLLEDPRAERRILGVRAIPTRRLERFAPVLADRIAFDPDPAVRAEAIAVCTTDAARMAVATTLALHAEDVQGEIRLAAIEGLRALKVPLADARLVARLADADPRVRAAAARSVLPTSTVGDALVARLADDDPAVRGAALDAVTRVVALHTPALVAPLVALLDHHDGDLRPAIYLLGKLPSPEVLGVLAACVTGERSALAHVASLVLGQLKAPIPEVAVETRLLRAARELASTDRDTQLAGVFEAKRLGAEAARPLLPALRRLGEGLAATHDPTLAQVRDALTDLGVPGAELPRTRPVLEAWRGIAPQVRDDHGAYTIATLALTPDEVVPGLWDRATGALLFVVEGATLFEILQGRAEVGVVRTADRSDRTWSFERYAIPAGKRLAQMEIPEDLANGWPDKLVSAGPLVTVFCDDDEPYRFHIKLGKREDHVVDDAPNRTPKRQTPGPKTRRRTSR